MKKTKKEKSKYASLQEWAEANPGGYRVAYSKGYIKNICNHFGWKEPKKIKLPTFWTIEECRKDALNYKSTLDWFKISNSAYQVARRNGWFEECTQHIIPIRKPKNFWTKDKCVSEASKYKSILEWRENSGSSYVAAHRNNWINKCCNVIKNNF